MLRDRGLVEATRDANRVIYTMRDRRVLDAVDLLRDMMNDDLFRRQVLAGTADSRDGSTMSRIDQQSTDLAAPLISCDAAGDIATCATGPIGRARSAIWEVVAAWQHLRDHLQGTTAGSDNTAGRPSNR